MSGEETGSRASLLNVQEVRAEDGPPLSVASNMRRTTKLQTFLAVPYLRDIILLGVFWSIGNLAVGRDLYRHWSRARAYGNKCGTIGGTFWDTGVGFDWVYRLAFELGVEGTNHNRMPGEDEIPESAAKVDAESANWRG